MVEDGNVPSMRLISLLVVAGVAGCAEGGPPAPGEPAVARREAPLQAPGGGAPRRVHITEYTVTDTEVRLVAESWPGRAEDPVLIVGDLRFTRYDHPHPTVLRFFTDGEKIPIDATILVLQYGDDPRSRVVLGQ